jgi:hypothetical protein
VTGTARPVSIPTVLPQGKQEKELFIACKFAEIQLIDGGGLVDMVSAPEEKESHGGSDVLAMLNGVEIGLQLTELKIPHRPSSADRAYKLTEKLLDEVVGRVSPSYPVLVYVGSHDDCSNLSIKLKKKDIQQLAGVISDAIVNEWFSPSVKEILEAPGLKLNPLVISPRLKKVISRIEISKIPEGHITMCQGRNNVYVNFNFKTVVASDDIYRSLLSSICQKKQGSEAPILLVWCCDKDFWGEMELITKMFKEVVSNSLFDHVDYIYLFFFINAEGMFEVNKQVFVIKEID